MKYYIADIDSISNSALEFEYSFGNDGVKEKTITIAYYKGVKAREECGNKTYLYYTPPFQVYALNQAWQEGFRGK